jgi:DNA-directed RNA polymerase subunit M/transcription elongation factor TFIIS
MDTVLVYETYVSMIQTTLPDKSSRAAPWLVTALWDRAASTGRSIAELMGLVNRSLTVRYGEFLEHCLGEMVPESEEHYSAWATEVVNISISNLLDAPIHYRDSPRGALYSALMSHSEIKDRAGEFAKKIELSCFNRIIHQSVNAGIVRAWDDNRFLQNYSARCGAVTAHLRFGGSVEDEAVQRLVCKLASGELLPEKMGEMSENDLCPSANIKELSRIEERAKQKVRSRGSKMYKCPKCGARDARVSEAQLKRSDEASTILCVCNICEWKFQD